MDSGLLIVVIAGAIALVLWTFGFDAGPSKRMPRRLWITMAVTGVLGLALACCHLLV